MKQQTNMPLALTKKFDGSFYHGKSASDNEKCYKIRYNDGNKEELTHRQTTLIVEYNPISFTVGFGPALSEIFHDTEKKQIQHSKDSVIYKTSHFPLRTQSQAKKWNIKNSFLTHYHPLIGLIPPATN